MTRRLLAAMALTLMSLVSPAAMADSRVAIDNLYGNLARAGLDLGLPKSAVRADPTPFRGMYILIDQRSERFAGYFNELGTLFGDRRGFNVISDRGLAPMTADQQSELRRALVKNLSADKTIAVRYGDGGDRRLLLFSAIDCPHCRNFELLLAEHGRDLDTTFVVIPSSLEPAQGPGVERWMTAARLVCAEDPGAAWKAYWVDRSLPTGQSRSADVRSVAEAKDAIDELFQAAGLQITGVPFIVGEDGEKRPVVTTKYVDYLETFYGPAGRPEPSSPGGQWLPD